MHNVRHVFILLALALGLGIAGTLPAASDTPAADSDRVIAFTAFTRTPDVAALLVDAGLSGDVYTPAEAVEVLIAEGERLLAAGDYPAAIPHYHLATAGAQSIDATDDLAFLRHRLGAANWALYGKTDDPQFARVALLYWQIERDIYAAEAYPTVFGAMAAYDIGRAHVALAAHESPGEHLQAAAEAFRGVTGWVEGHHNWLPGRTRTVAR